MQNKLSIGILTAIGIVLVVLLTLGVISMLEGVKKYQCLNNPGEFLTERCKGVVSADD